MTISARAHYACLAMIELGVHRDESSPVAIREITDRHGIPGPFLVQILRTLRSIGWVESTRGSQGGYRLSINPEKLSILDIVEAVDGQETGFRSEAKSTAKSLGTEESNADTMLGEVWTSANQAARQTLSSTLLIDLVERSKQEQQTMFYI